MSLNIHLGCGKRRLEGYVHVDVSDYPHIDHRHDIRSLPMFADDSADLLYASHVLEYFDRVEVLDVLAQWRRVLRPGGVLRLAVPDFAALARVYLDSGDLGLVIGPLYGRWQAGPELVLHHRTTYDFRSLAGVLEGCGFRDVRRMEGAAADGARTEAFNLGLGQGYSVAQVLAAVEAVSGRKVPHSLAPRRAGDPPMLVAEPALALRELDWKPRFTRLEDTVATAWSWHSRRG